MVTPVSKLTGEREGGHKEVLYRQQSPLFSAIKEPLCFLLGFFFLHRGTRNIGKEGNQSDPAGRCRKELGKKKKKVLKRKVEAAEN